MKKNSKQERLKTTSECNDCKYKLKCPLQVQQSSFCPKFSRKAQTDSRQPFTNEVLGHYRYVGKTGLQEMFAYTHIN